MYARNGSWTMRITCHPITNGFCRRNIPGPERTAYRKAVECLMQAPQIYPNVTGPKYVYSYTRSAKGGLN